MKTTALLLLTLLLGNARLAAQDIPLGSWQTHVSYQSALHVQQVQNRFFCATYQGLFSYDPAQDSTVLYSKINGLHDTGISSLAYDPEQQLLVLAYRNGNLDLVSLDEQATPLRITEWPLLRDAGGLPANRQVNELKFRNGLAYAATSFGIVVLDPARREVRESYRYIGKEGAEVAVREIAFTSDSLYALSSQGLLRSSLASEVNRQFYGNWQPVAAPFEIASVAVVQNRVYGGKAGEGIFRNTPDGWQLVYPVASRHYRFTVAREQLLAALDNRVVAISGPDQAESFQDALLQAPQEATRDAAGHVWVADARTGLVSNEAGAFRSYSPASGDTTIAIRTDSLLKDRTGNEWVRLPARLGGGILVRNPTTRQQRFLTVSPNNGGLPSSQVNSLSLDRDGLVWFAADRGVGYFVPEGVLSGGAVNAILPIFGQRRLLSNETSTAIVTEPGNRKWIGTRNGLYLLSPDGTSLIRQFSVTNSPLPAETILALQFDAAEGRLYIDTPNGMVSYRSDATEPAPSLQAVTIFPNPVRPGYAGLVGINGLVDNTVVRITDLTGRLVYETRSQGGTASWNLQDYTGRRARGGLYLVLLTAPDGAQSMAGKLAIVE